MRTEQGEFNLQQTQNIVELGKALDRAGGYTTEIASQILNRNTENPELCSGFVDLLARPLGDRPNLTWISFWEIQETIRTGVTVEGSAGPGKVSGNYTLKGKRVSIAKTPTVDQIIMKGGLSIKKL